MSERGLFEYLSDILEAVNRIQDYTIGMDYDVFLDDLKTRDAVIRNLEVIGEATKQVGDDIRQQFPDVPWKEMAGVRDILIHHYFGVNFEIVWSIIRTELSTLRENIEKILAQLPPNT